MKPREGHSKGNIYALDKFTSLSSKLVKFDSTKSQDQTWTAIVYDGEPSFVIDTFDRIFLVNASNNPIEVYTENGVKIDSIENAGTFSNSNVSTGRIYLKPNKIFVLDLNQNMKIYDSNKTFLDSFSLTHFGDFAVDDDENIYLTYTHEIIKYSSNGVESISEMCLQKEIAKGCLCAIPK